jgi:hypothetical protein
VREVSRYLCKKTRDPYGSAIACIREEPINAVLIALATGLQRTAKPKGASVGAFDGLAMGDAQRFGDFRQPFSLTSRCRRSQRLHE